MTYKTSIFASQQTNFWVAGIFSLASVFLALFVYHTWQEEHREHAREMRTVVEASEKLINAMFAEVESDLRNLGQNWQDQQDQQEAFSLKLAYRDLQRFVEFHRMVKAARLISLDGQLWYATDQQITQTGQLLSMQPAFREYLQQAAQPGEFKIGQVEFNPASKIWVIPLRLVIKNSQGRAQFIIEAQLSADFLVAFWKDVPISRDSAIFLVRDDGRLLSRHPLPAPPHNFVAMYSERRSGTLVTYLQQNNFPRQGEVSGYSRLLNREATNVFQRLSNYPATLSIVTPNDYIRQEWWQRINVAVYLALFLLCGALGVYWYLRQRHVKWQNDEARLARIQSEFVSVVSHELRTPITSIRGSLGLLLGGVAGPLPDEAKKLLDIAHNNSLRLSKLVNDILDMEKLSLGKVQLSMQPVDLRQLAHQALESISGYCNKMHVQIKAEIPEQSLPVQADGERLIQVMLNFLSNAAKFSSAGQTITLRVSATEQGFKLEVQDQGKGIPDDFKQKIFEPFTQEDASTTRSQEGTGLGLHICKILIERMGGEIGFNSHLGHGSTFWFHLDKAAI